MNEITALSSNQLCVIVGGHLAAERLLKMAAHLALRGPLLMLDCGNRANVIQITHELRRLTPDPLRFAAQIQVARAFTCEQVATLLEQASRTPTPRPVMVFDLLSTFYDESIPYATSARLLQNSLKWLAQLSQSVPVLVSARPPHADFPERGMFLAWLCQLSGPYWMEAETGVQSPQQLSLFAER